MLHGSHLQPISPLLGLGSFLEVEMDKQYNPKYDLNHDGMIDADDFSLFRGYYKKEVDKDDPMSVACDFNGDGKVTAIDGSMFLDHEGTHDEQVMDEVQRGDPWEEIVARWKERERGERQRNFIRLLLTPPWLPWEGPPLPKGMSLAWR